MSRARWAIVIGIDQYWEASACLKGAVKDALRMREWLLGSNEGDVPDTHLHLLLAPLPDSELPQGLGYLPADSKTIVEIVEDIARRNKGTARGERLFFYYAGHGLTARIDFSNEPALVPTDFTPDHPDRALKLRGVVEYLEATHIPEQFFFIDGCRNIPWDAEVRIGDMPRPQKLNPDVSAPQQFIFYATSPGVRAAEIQQAANERGAFTDALVRGLRGDRKAQQWDDTSEKYLVTVNSLFDFISAEVTGVAKTVSEGARLIQVPSLAGERGAVGKRANNPILASFDVPLPIPDLQRFSIALVHLENDEHRELEKFIVDALGSFEGVEVLRFDRPILFEGTQPEERERTGRERALKYLTESGADVLIWGAKLELGGKVAARLHWTTSAQSRRPTSPYVPADFKLPEIFWDDLGEILGLVAITQSIGFFREQGRFTAPRLSTFIDKVRSLVSGRSGQAWNFETGAQVRLLFAGALVLSNEQTGDRERLEEALAALRSMLKEQTRERVPTIWAKAQSQVGSVLVRLGESGTTYLLKEAVVAFREALKVFTGEREPLEWASTQSNLADTLRKLGELQLKTNPMTAAQIFQEAVNTHQEALKVFALEKATMGWAMTQNNLGLALKDLGLARVAQSRLDIFLRKGSALEDKGEAYLLRAVVAQREALKVFTQENHPQYWARTQMYLGDTLRTLGELESETGHLEEAVAVFRKALALYDDAESKPIPPDCADVHCNLAIALEWLGERSKNHGLVFEALDNYFIAWGVYYPESPVYASVVIQGVKAAMDALRMLNKTAFSEWISQHTEIISQMGLL